MRVYLSGTLLIVSVLLLALHKVPPLNIEAVMHPFSDIEYSISSFWLNQYLYTAPVIYLLIDVVIKPRFERIFKIDLMYAYLVHSAMMMIDNYLFYDWTLVSVKIYGVVLILLTFAYMGEYWAKKDIGAL